MIQSVWVWKCGIPEREHTHPLCGSIPCRQLHWPRKLWCWHIIITVLLLLFVSLHIAFCISWNSVQLFSFYWWPFSLEVLVEMYHWIMVGST